MLIELFVFVLIAVILFFILGINEKEVTGLVMHSISFLFSVILFVNSIYIQVIGDTTTYIDYSAFAIGLVFMLINIIYMVICFTESVENSRKNKKLHIGW